VTLAEVEVKPAVDAATNPEDPLTGPAGQILLAAQTFIADAEALQEILEVTSPVLIAKSAEHRAEAELVIGRNHRGTEKELTLDFSELNRLLGLLSKQTRGGFLFRGHLLVALVSRFDVFTSTVARQLLVAFPSRLGKKTVLFSDAVQFSTIHELKKKIIDNEIDERMHGSHLEQLDFLSSLVNVALGADEPELISRFVELTERRNCHIHSGGCVSPQYRLICLKNKVKFKESPTDGKALVVGIKYLEHSRQVLSEMAFKIAQTIVRKAFNETKETADMYVDEIGLRMLSDHRYGEALMIFDYAAQLKGVWAGDESSKRNVVVNKAQALIGLEKPNEAMKLIESMDWTAAHPKYLMAIHLLKKDFKAAAELMPTTGISEDAYRKWPIFEKFRATDDFKNAFLLQSGHNFDESVLGAASEVIAESENSDAELIGVDDGIDQSADGAIEEERSTLAVGA
jgi:hypothetical protein